MSTRRISLLPRFPSFILPARSLFSYIQGHRHAFLPIVGAPSSILSSSILSHHPPREIPNKSLKADRRRGEGRVRKYIYTHVLPSNDDLVEVFAGRRGLSARLEQSIVQEGRHFRTPTPSRSGNQEGAGEWKVTGSPAPSLKGDDQFLGIEVAEVFYHPQEGKRGLGIATVEEGKKRRGAISPTLRG